MAEVICSFWHSNQMHIQIYVDQKVFHLHFSVGLRYSIYNENNYHNSDEKSTFLEMLVLKCGKNEYNKCDITVCLGEAAQI